MSAAAAIAIARRRLIRRFREAGATSAECAMPLESLRARPSWLFRRMVRSGVFVQVPDGRYYIDESAAVEYQRRARSRALIAGGVSILVFLLLWLVTSLRH